MTDVDRLKRRLERERAARAEAESIAERTTRELYDRNRELILLEGIAAAANHAAGVVEALRQTVEHVCTHLSWPVGVAWLVSDDGTSLDFAGVSYTTDESRFADFAAATADQAFALGEGLPGRVLEQDRAASIRDVTTDPNFPRAPAAAACGLRGAIAFPVLVADRTVAVIECFSELPTDPSAEILRVFQQAGIELGRVFERAEIQARLQHQATHDALTGLPNRVLFADRLEQTLALARRDGAEAAVMLIDLDRFKEVNDTLGHQQGDALLSKVGGRLRQALRESDTIARLGGDEFGILLPQVDGAQGAHDAARRLRATLAAPLQLDGVLVQVDASIGIALFPEHGADGETLLRQADVGMYEAKRHHTGHVIYAADRDPYSPRRLGMVAALRSALEAGALDVHYQPKVDVASGGVRGVEALVRWSDSQYGPVSPAEFIPLAESTGLIRPLTAHVLRTALAQARAWLDAGMTVPVAVNLSARSLLDLGFPDEVLAHLEGANVPSALLELEVTESMMLEDPERSLDVLQRLDAMGVSLSVDDFGTGYSSLAQLRNLPVRELKIDRGFVGSMQGDDRDAFIVRSSIQLGHNLGLTVVAEGVEDEATLDALAELGCDRVQGYLLMRPSPADTLTPWLAEQMAKQLRAA